MAPVFSASVVFGGLIRSCLLFMMAFCPCLDLGHIDHGRWPETGMEPDSEPQNPVNSPLSPPCRLDLREHGQGVPISETPRTSWSSRPSANTR